MYECYFDIMDFVLFIEVFGLLLLLECLEWFVAPSFAAALPSHQRPRHRQTAPQAVHRRGSNLTQVLN